MKMDKLYILKRNNPQNGNEEFILATTNKEVADEWVNPTTSKASDDRTCYSFDIINIFNEISNENLLELRTISNQS
jgi:hypothetical protein